MIDWRRRADPAFFDKEPLVLKTQAQVPRYSEEEQAEVRLEVLAHDGMLHVVTTIAALSAYLAVTALGTLDPRADWQTLWAFAVLAVAGPRALPWWPKDDARQTWRHAFLGLAIVVVPALWSNAQPALFYTGMLTAATLLATRGEIRLLAMAAALAVLIAHALVIQPGVTLVSTLLLIFGVRTMLGTWRAQPQVAVPVAFAAVLVACTYSIALHAAELLRHVPVEIGLLAVTYLSVCIMAGRIRNAELVARPEGVLSLPQSVVPLLDRSHHHAVITWLP
ncbi:MAG: hypothetical protein ACRENA_07810 [Vulcanimicrobiaceae bacterium]